MESFYETPVPIGLKNLKSAFHSFLENLYFQLKLDLSF